MIVAIYNQDNDIAEVEIPENAPLDDNCISPGYSFRDGLIVGFFGASTTLFVITMILLLIKY